MQAGLQNGRAANKYKLQEAKSQQKNWPAAEPLRKCFRCLAYLSSADRQAILQILQETKPGLARSWKAAGPVAANSRYEH
jgi:hypothetical protein